MRLSAGRQRTVTARPHIDSPVRERIPGSMKLNRPMASATFAAAIPRKRSTSASGSRGGAAPIRKPSFGLTDEDGGGDRIATVGVVEVRRESIDDGDLPHSTEGMRSRSLRRYLAAPKRLADGGSDVLIRA